MTANPYKIAIIQIAVMLSLSACNGMSKPESTNAVSTLEPTILTLPFSNTSTTIDPPKETDNPKPKALSGIVMLAGDETQPFTTSIELRGKDNFSLYEIINTDADGNFEISDIPSGDYELWVLITAEAKMISGCDDIWLPNNQWRIGIKFQGSDPTIIEAVSLHEGISRSENFKAYNLHPTGFYAVSPDFTIVSVFDEDIEITFICK